MPSGCPLVPVLVYKALGHLKLHPSSQLGTRRGGGGNLWGVEGKRIAGRSDQPSTVFQGPGLCAPFLSLNPESLLSVLHGLRISLVFLRGKAFLQGRLRVRNEEDPEQ